MKKQKIQLVGILVLLLVLIAATFGMKYLGKREEQAGQTLVLSMDPQKVEALTILNSNGRLELEKSGKSWILEKKSGGKADVDQTKVKGILESLSEIKSKKIIRDVKDQDPYGLTKPNITVSIRLSDHSIKTVKVGSYSGDASAYYATVDEGKTVFLMDASVEGAFNVTEKDALSDGSLL